MDFTQDETINKLKLLFLLDKMEIPLTENSIVDICTSRNNWLNYMDYKQIMPQLIDAGFIYDVSPADDEESKFALTYSGRNCLSHFFLRIPQSLREEITNFAKQNRITFKRNQEYVSNYTKNQDGSYTINLKIKEPLVSQPLLEIKLKVPTRHSAIIACNKWKEEAANIFENLYDSIVEIN